MWYTLVNSILLVIQSYLSHRQRPHVRWGILAIELVNAISSMFVWLLKWGKFFYATHPHWPPSCFDRCVSVVPNNLRIFLVHHVITNTLSSIQTTRVVTAFPFLQAYNNRHFIVMPLTKRQTPKLKIPPFEFLWCEQWMQSSLCSRAFLLGSIADLQHPLSSRLQRLTRQPSPSLPEGINDS